MRHAMATVGMKKKGYKITFELKEGYADDAPEHSVHSAKEIIRIWIGERLAAGEPTVSGILQEGVLLYPAVAGSEHSVAMEQCCIFIGELSSPEDAKRENKEVRKTLESLAIALKSALGQRSVFITYRNKHWCV